MKQCTIANVTVLLFLILTLQSVVAHDYIGIIKTCSGWRLNSLPEVKNFLKGDADDYPIEVIFSSGDPVFILVDSEGKEIESHSLVHLKQNEIGLLISSKGFKKFDD